MAKAVDNTTVGRSPEDKGNQLKIHVTLYDGGLWQVNGEPCENRAEVERVVGNVIDKLTA